MKIFGRSSDEPVDRNRIKTEQIYSRAAPTSLLFATAAVVRTRHQYEKRLTAGPQWGLKNCVFTRFGENVTRIMMSPPVAVVWLSRDMWQQYIYIFVYYYLLKVSSSEPFSLWHYLIIIYISESDLRKIYLGYSLHQRCRKQITTILYFIFAYPRSNSRNVTKGNCLFVVILE